MLGAQFAYALKRVLSGLEGGERPRDYLQLIGNCNPNGSCAIIDCHYPHPLRV